MRPAKKKANRRTVSTAGSPMIMNALTPARQASSAETRIELAPNQAALKESAMTPGERLRAARKKSSRFRLFLEKSMPAPVSRTR